MAGKQIAVAVMLGLLTLQGCSINRVLNSPPPVVVERVKVGESRQAITSVLGAPKSVERKQDGSIERYEFFSGYTGDDKGRLSIIYASVDIFTFGIAEPFFDSHEKKTGSGTAGTAVVDYGMDDLAQSVLITKADGQPWFYVEPPPELPPEPPLQQLPPVKVATPEVVLPNGWVELVVQGDIKAELEMPDSSLSSAAGKGAAQGAMAGFQGGFICSIAFVICSPVLAAGGALIGSATGPMVAVSSSSWEKAATVYSERMAGKDSKTVLAEELVEFAHKHGYEVYWPTGQLVSDQVSRKDPAKGPPSAILELSNVTIMLEPDNRSGLEINPPRRVISRVNVQLIGTANDGIYHVRDISDLSGPVRSMHEWLADDAKLLRDEIAVTLPRLAKSVVSDLFLQQRFQPRMVDHNWLIDMYIEGLQPIHPRLQKSFRIDDAPMISLTPTLRWEAFPGNKVTYDLRIWSLDNRGPYLTRPLFYPVGGVVLERDGLVEPTYTVEVPLEPSKFYFWSVRAHFENNGRLRDTDWSRVVIPGKSRSFREFYKFKTIYYK